MNNKKRILLMIGIMFLGIGLSFAYYVVKYIFNGEGAKIDATTVVTLGDSNITVEGNIDLGTGSDIAEVMPGHKFASKIKVTATGPNAFVMYNLIWTGNDDYGNNNKAVNNLSTPLNYTVYKVKNEAIEPNIKCYEKQDYVNNLIAVSEICNITNEDELGKVVATGEIPTGESTVTLALDEEIISSNAGTVVYYYVIVEYPDTNTNQSTDMELVDNVIEGIVTVEASKSNGTMPLSPSEAILANAKIIVDTEPDIYSATMRTTGVIYKEKVSATLTNTTTPKVTATLLSETNNDSIYYFRGAPTDNYVKFAGFYWRIIRINKNGSMRMIYAGDANIIDKLNNKKEVLANGSGDYSNITFNYTDEEGNTYTSEAPFNTIRADEGLGYMYTDNKLDGYEKSSTVKIILDKWYEDNLLSYAEYIDNESGFCGDRNYERKSGGADSWWVSYVYAAGTRLHTDNAYPTYECKNTYDYYTVKDASNGNKALTYPIGLITADEVVFAGGVTEKTDNSHVNKIYYLYNGNSYWTMTPSSYSYDNWGSNTRMFNVAEDGSLGYTDIYDDDFITAFDGFYLNAIRPVINLTPNINLTGKGTIDSPYELV